MDKKREPMNKNRRGGLRCRASWHMTAKPISTKSTGGETPSVLRGLDQWIRHRLRAMIWKQWKRGKVRFANLRQRHIGTDLAAPTAVSLHGPWRLANSPVLSSALPLVYFDALGIPRLFEVL